MFIKNITQVLKFSLVEPEYATKSIKFRLLNLFNYKKPQLKKLILLLTYKCNLSCKMCALGENRNKNIQLPRLQQELYLEDIRDVIDFAQKANSSVWLTGGEPLLCDKWMDIARYVKEKELRCYLQTNGVMLEKYKNEIIDYVDFLNVSVDGTPTTHDIIRGEKDTFNKVLSGLMIIDETKKILGKKKPYINICYTVTEESYKTLDKMIKILQESRIDINNFNFQHLEFINSDILKRYKERFEKEGKDKNLLNIFSVNSSDVDTDYLVEEIKKLKKSKLRFNVVFSPDISSEDTKKYYHNPQSIPKRVFRKCKRPYEEIFVHPSGEIWTCPSRASGNFKEEKFEILWNKVTSNISHKDYTICNDCLGELYMYQMIILYLQGKIK